MQQLRLPFAEEGFSGCTPLTLLRVGAALVLTLSGGKDNMTSKAVMEMMGVCDSLR
jgi:hypothetical protein